MGARLASIESQAEQDAVLALTGSADAWIGLTDFLEEGVFSWVDGSTVDFTNWVPDQPDNGGTGEHCVRVRGHGGWDDVACNRMEAFVCQEEEKGKGPREKTKH